MKLRTIVLAGVAAAALSAGPAMATETQGWYLGLGVGWDHMEPVHVVTAPPASINGRLGMLDNAMVAGSFGYKWTSGLRLEFETSYSWHDLHNTVTPSAHVISGTSDLAGAMVNFLYDWDLGGQWSLSFGGGLGAGSLHLSARDSA